MNTKELAKILELSVAQRLLIMEQIWDSITDCPECIPLSDSRKQELDVRLNAFYENPKAGVSWEAVKEKLLSTP